ncbi:MAG: hypothetical protein ABIP51_20865 [Bacteroidia bacterium]
MGKNPQLPSIENIEEQNKGEVVVKIYQILTGLSDDEYYTYDHPTFSTDYTDLICTHVIIKNSVSRQVINKQINVHYASKFIETLSFLLEDGVVIKALNSNDLEWLNKTEEDAIELLKDRELEVYREIMPKLVAMSQNNNNIEQNRNNKSLLI